VKPQERLCTWGGSTWCWCKGGGVSRGALCDCSASAAFDDVFKRYLLVRHGDPAYRSGGFSRRGEFSADVTLAARASLSREDFHLFGFMAATPECQCTATFGKSTMRRIKTTLGRECVTRGLAPTTNYFGGISQGEANYWQALCDGTQTR